MLFWRAIKCLHESDEPTARNNNSGEQENSASEVTTLWRYTVVVAVVVTFFNHDFVHCKATLIWRVKIYEIKYNISLNDVHT